MQQVLKSSKEAIQHPKESFPTVQPHPEVKLQKPTTISAAGVNESLEFSASQVGGHLQYFTSVWRQITTSHWVLQTKKGHKLEFLEPPPDSSPPPIWNHPDNPDLETQVLELLNKGAIERAPSRSGFFSPMFVVSKKDGGSRPYYKSEEL